MKILHTAQTYRQDCHGVSGAVRDLVEGLGEAGHEVSVLAPAEAGAPRENGVMRVQMDSSGGVDAKTLTRARSLKPDLIHIHDPIALCEPALILAERLNVPVAFTLHRPRSSVQDNFTYRRASGAMVASSDLVVAPSMGARKWAAAHARNGDVKIIPTGVPEVFRTKRSTREKARMTRRLDPHNFVVGLVGSNRSVNGLDDALAALIELLTSSPSARLALTGTMPFRNRVMAKLPEGLRERAVLNEAADRGKALVSWMDSLDLMMAPSPSDPEGRNALRAMTRGVAVLAPSAAPWTRPIREGENGFLARGDDAASFKAALMGARRSLRTRRELIAAAAKETVARLTLERAVALHSSAYESLMRRKNLNS